MRRWVLLSLLFIFSLNVACVNAAPWKMVYAADKDGKVLEGSMVDLLKGIREGRDVKVAVDNYHSNVWNYVRCQEVYIPDVKDKPQIPICYMYILTPDSKTHDVKIKSQFYWYVGLIHADGHLFSYRYRLDGTPNDNDDHIATRWFIQE